MNFTSASITMHVLWGALLLFLAISLIASQQDESASLWRFEPLAFFLVAFLSTLALFYYAGYDKSVENLRSHRSALALLAPVMLLYCLALSSFIALKLNPQWNRLKPFLLLAFSLSLLALPMNMIRDERKLQIISHVFLAAPLSAYCIISMLPLSLKPSFKKVGAVLILTSSFQLILYREAPNSFGETVVLSFSDEIKPPEKVRKNEKNSYKKRFASQPGGQTKK